MKHFFRRYSLKKYAGLLSSGQRHEKSSQNPSRTNSFTLRRQKQCYSPMFTMNSTQVEPDGINANIAPFAFQYYARDFLEAYTKDKGGSQFSPARLFLLGRCI